LAPADAIPSQGIDESDYSSSYSIHGPINITCNEDFISQGWNGTGSSEDPFLIKGLNITSDSDCIVVSNTTAFFMVTECLLTSETKYPYSLYEDLVGAGLDLSNVSNCIIESCYINWKYHGILSFNSSKCSFTQNVIQMNMWDGVRLSETRNCNVTGNGISDNGANGIYIKDSPFSIISKNIIRRNIDYGSIVISCDNSSLIDNEANDDGEGFYIIYSDYVEILGNIVTGGNQGLILAQEKGLKVINNNVTSVDSHAISLQYVESSTFTKNLVEESSTGYRIDNSIQCSFSENMLHQNDRGIIASGIMNCLFTNNTFSTNFDYAIWFDQDSTENKFYWNNLNGNSDFLAKDEGLRNLWDDNVTLGNTWGDYQGFGVYVISGIAGSVDRYPQGFHVDPMPLLILQGLGLTGMCTILFLGAYFLSIRRRKLSVEAIGLKPH
ncbi:MAG: hypothetical protein E4H14_19395, partial [Candidatus Thorarchaeota archaeon]